MSGATTIIFARDDLSIPGAPDNPMQMSGQADAIQADFFDLVSRSKPDVIVLDFSRPLSSGTDTILTIRQRTDIPILVVCDPNHAAICS